MQRKFSYLGGHAQFAYDIATHTWLRKQWCAVHWGYKECSPGAELVWASLGVLQAPCSIINSQ